jgi:hypothetical protein
LSRLLYKSACFLQNKANFKMGNINISTAITKAYAKEQRTMNNERYSKQTQSNPISNAQTPYFACRRRCRLGYGGVCGSLNSVLYSGEGLGLGLEFFGLAGVRYYMVLQVGWVLQRSENAGDMVADGGIGGRGRASAAYSRQRGQTERRWRDVGRPVLTADIMLLGAFNQVFLVNPAETASDIASETQGGRVWFKG